MTMIYNIFPLFLVLTYGKGWAIESYSVPRDFLNETVAMETMPNLKLHNFRDSFYYFGSIFKGTYFQAIQFCKYLNMELLSIESAEENQYLYDELKFFFGKDEYQIWTSGTALVSDKHTFYWLSTGKKVDYSSWLPNQPDNAGNQEKCVHVYYNKVKYSTLGWNDHGCNNEKYVICESTLPKSVAKILLESGNCNITVNVPAS